MIHFAVLNFLQMPIDQRALKKYVNECLLEHGADEESLNSMSQVTEDF